MSLASVHSADVSEDWDLGSQDARSTPWAL